MFRVLFVMTLATVAAAFGQILARWGMQQVGALEHYTPAALLTYLGHAASNPYVIGGTVLNLIFYLLFLAALSWTGVTVALPLTALEYGFAVVLAILLLNEAVPPLRWVGIVLVVVGVILITADGTNVAIARPR
jgi:drug/metabolite transporter (DMT)-like permease